jgi:hypothetical protein
MAGHPIRPARGGADLNSDRRPVARRRSRRRLALYPLSMPAISFELCEVPVEVISRSPRLIELFADYFRYYHPRPVAAAIAGPSSPGTPYRSPRPITVELRRRRELPPRERLIPPAAKLLSRTGNVWLWQEGGDSASGERFYLHAGTAAFRADPERGRLAPAPPARPLPPARRRRPLAAQRALLDLRRAALRKDDAHHRARARGLAPGLG